jgi:serine/threonine-protein kinase PknG
MEYVPGRPLTDPELPELSAEHVIGYLLRVLRVFHYLHEGGYLFCDLKPGNLMAHGTDLTLIDLGSVREAGTPGIGQFTQDFAAPELPVTGPTVATDLYTVGATLERLCSWHGTGWTGEPPSSLRWFTERATQRDPGARFGSAAEMAGQLSGVLRDVVTRRTGRALPAPSSHFARATTLIDNGLTRVPPVERWLTRAVRRAAERGECAPLDTAPPRPGEAAAGLPDPHPDPADAAAAFLTTQVSDDLPEAIRQLTGYQVPSREVHLALFRARLRSGDLPGAHRALLAAATGTRDAHPVQAGWRRHWHDGLLALAERRFRDARASFTAAARQLPGETAPRLALAVCAECVAVGRAELEAVAAAYLAVWHTDPWYESAALGYGRVRARLGDRAEAVRVLSEVPSTSPHYRAVRTVALRVLATPLLTPSGEILPPGPAQLADSAARLTALPAGDPETRRLAALVDEARLAASGPDRAARASARAALEGRYRALAGQARDAWARTVLIDLANAVRPRTPR